jgi:thiamine-phosphate pyrophosphorylase
MDQRLITWARQVKQRRQTPYPTLWLFTDAARLPNPLPVIARLPAHISGVVLRHDADPNRVTLGRAAAKICRQRRILLVVAGDGRLAAALQAGLHLRDGTWPDHIRPKNKLLTSSAHSGPDIIRARSTGAKLIFISPAFATASHPGEPALGHLRWLRLARLAPPAKACALGGISGQKIKTLSHSCCAAGSITALSEQHS